MHITSNELYRASEEDCDELVAATNLAYAKNIDTFHPEGVPRVTKEEMLKILRCSKAKVLCYKDQGAIVGHVVYNSHFCAPRDPSRAAGYGMVSILPEWQGKGLGKALIRAVEELAAEEGYEAVEVQVASPTMLNPFYKKLGYSEIETFTVDKPSFVRRDLWDTFHFTRMEKIVMDKSIPES
eukprot:Sspe_Gene.38523::Locus_18558_Transcript_1_1_Confidence_1.000_Length_2620::g.38523::m.38523